MRRSGAPEDSEFFGLAVECEPRGQIAGADPGELIAPATDEWLLDGILSVGRFIKGANWTVYKDAAVARGANPAHFVEDATFVEVTNSAVHPFLSLFDVVICNTFQHGGMTPRDCKKIKDVAALAGARARPLLGARPPHIVLHGWKDDMPSGYHSSTLWNHYYEALRDNDLFLRGTQVGTQGSWMCDPEETLPWPGGVVKDLFAVPPTETAWQAEGSGHNWHVDYTKANFAAVMAAAALAQWQNYWTAGGAAGERIDAYMAHDIVPRYPARNGTATNLPVIDGALWEAATRKIPLAYQDVLGGLSPTIGKIWTTYGVAWDRVMPGVAPFIDTVGAIYYNYEWQAMPHERVRKDFLDAAAAGIPMVLGSNVPHESMLSLFTSTHPRWLDYLKWAREIRYTDRLYIASCNEIGYLFWQPGMRPVV